MTLPTNAAEFRDWRKGRALTLEQMNQARNVLTDYEAEERLTAEANPQTLAAIKRDREAFFAQFPET